MSTENTETKAVVPTDEQMWLAVRKLDGPLRWTREMGIVDADGCEADDNVTTIVALVNEVPRLLTERKKLAAELATLREEKRWFAPWENLPENHQKVWAKVPIDGSIGYQVLPAYFDYSSLHGIAVFEEVQGRMSMIRVENHTHWRPRTVPAPPVTESTELSTELKTVTEEGNGK